MKTAIDCYARGKQKEANADDYSRQRIYSVGRFICPECGEIVHLTGSKYSNHFAHYKKTVRSAECDRRINGIPTQSVYERLGLPIYLRKSIDGYFRLFMGFRRLPLKILEQAERKGKMCVVLQWKSGDYDRKRVCRVRILAPADS